MWYKLKIVRIMLLVILILALMGGAFGFGIYVGFNNRPEFQKVTSLINKEETPSNKGDFAPFWKVWNMLTEKYPGIEEIPDQQKIWGAISGLASSLDDPYTTFFPPEEDKMFKASINGSFGGVGMEVGMKDKVMVVVAPLKDTPAYRAGIKAGDKILKIDDAVTTDMSVEKAVSLIRGEKGTTVRVTIFRDGEKESREISLVRDTINIPTLDAKLRDDGVFVISLYNFSLNSPDLFRKALQEFVDSKSNKLVLDLRGNPGGFLDAAVDMTSWFLPAGKAIVIEDFGKNTEQKIYRSKGYNIFNSSLKMIILVDGGSASASEIMAGALHDHGVAKLVGEKTYGKGSVQELLPVTPDTDIKITIAKWLTPNGVSISKQGIKPDYEVKITEKDVASKKDPQLEKAVELLKNM